VPWTDIDCVGRFGTTSLSSKPRASSYRRGDDLAPTEGWSDRSQNCLHDMRIVGNT
jgi:hypothetical protein